MGQINKPLCATSYGNTGFGECSLDISKIMGAIQVPEDFAISEADIPNLLAFLQAKTIAGIGARIYPYHGFITLTDGTEDVTINTTDYGVRIPVRDGFYDWTFRYLSGGVLLHQQISKNAGSGKFFLFYDDKGVLFGYRSEGKLKGIPTSIFYVQPWRPNTGADVANYSMRMIFDPTYINGGNLGYVKVETFNLFDVQGLESVDLILESLVGNVAHITLQSAVSGINLYDAYSTVLNVPAAWTAYDNDGNAVTITGVTANAGNKQFYLTYNAAAFNALDGGEFILTNLKPASVLSNPPYNVDGYEGIPLKVVIPAS